MIFSKGSKLHFIYDDGIATYGKTYFISEASLSQTVREASYSRNTIQKTELVDKSFPDTKGAVNISFSLPLSRDEVWLFTWMGFKPLPVSGVDPTIDSLKIDPTYRQEHHTLTPTLYLESTGIVYRVTDAVFNTAEVSLGRNKVATLNITAEGSTMELISSMDTAMSWEAQTYADIYNSPLEVVGIPHLRSVTINITRDIRWVGGKRLHQIGQVVGPSNPVVTRFAIGGSITGYTSENAPIYLESDNHTVQIIDNEYQFLLDSCYVSTRYTTNAPVHQYTVDYKLNPNDNSFIII